MNELARVTSLEALAVALKVRRRQLGLPQTLVDDVAGLQGGYTAKIECGLKGLGKLSLPLLLGALRCELVLVPSADKNADSYGATTRYTHSPKKSHHAQIGGKGGRARAANLTRERRRAAARKAGRARWAKVRARDAAAQLVEDVT